jgi:hypothetical protein
MKKKLYIGLTCIIGFLSIHSCQLTHYSSPEACTGKQIILSEGGGFSGQTTQTIILENGQVFIKTVFPQSIKESDQLSGKTTAGIFDKLESLNLEEINFSHPGNMAYALACKKGENFYEAKWGDPGFQAPEEVLSCYQFILDQIKSNQKP